MKKIIGRLIRTAEKKEFAHLYRKGIQDIIEKSSWEVGFRFGELCGTFIGGVEILSDLFRNCSLKRYNLDMSEKLLEISGEFKKEIYELRKSIEEKLSEDARMQNYKDITKKFDKVIKDYEQARKELCDYVATQKPWGQE